MVVVVCGGSGLHVVHMYIAYPMLLQCIKHFSHKARGHTVSVKASDSKIHKQYSTHRLLRHVTATCLQSEVVRLWVTSPATSGQ